MINIKLYKNEIELIRESIQSSKWFGNEPKLCDRLLKKLAKALTIPVVRNCDAIFEQEAKITQEEIEEDCRNIPN